MNNSRYIFGRNGKKHLLRSAVLLFPIVNFPFMCKYVFMLELYAYLSFTKLFTISCIYMVFIVLALFLYEFPRTIEIDIRKDHFLIYNRLAFWRPKVKFSYHIIQKMHMEHLSFKHFSLYIILRDGRKLVYDIYDLRGIGIQKYFSNIGLIAA